MARSAHGKADAQAGNADAQVVVSARTHAMPAVLLTLDRGIRVLEKVADERGRATARALSAALDINISTCYQLLRTLHVNGYVDRLPGGRYGLGPRFTALVDQYALTAAPPAGLRAVLHALHGSAGESVYVSLRHGARLRIAAYIEGTKAVRVGPLEVGYSDHLHARAAGKSFLAFTDPQELYTYVSKDHLARLTPSTITDGDALLRELRTTRERGYAIETEEFAEGVGCIGAVLVGADGVATGAVGISLPISRLAERQDEIITLTMDAGRRGSQVLGYDGPYPPHS